MTDPKIDLTNHPTVEAVHIPGVPGVVYPDAPKPERTRLIDDAPAERTVPISFGAPTVEVDTDDAPAVKPRRTTEPKEG